MRHLIRVMNRHDLTQKKTKTMTNTETKTMTKTMLNTFREHLQSLRLLTFETFDQSDAATKTKTNTMTMTNTFREFPQ